MNALKENPYCYKVWFNLALANYKLGDKKEALNNIKNAYALNPADPGVAQIYNLMNTNTPINFGK